MAGTAGDLSLGKLVAIRECADELRRNLQAAFVDEGPRLQMPLYRTLSHFAVDYLEPLFRTDWYAEADQAAAAPAGHSAKVEAEHLVQHYLQEVLAACIFLVDVDGLSSVELSAAGLPRPPHIEEGRESQFYVSAAQRHFCVQLLFYLCWCAPVRLHGVLEALYPLVDNAEHALLNTAPGASEMPALKNKIAPNMLRHFHARRGLVHSLLNGVVLQRGSGVRALLRALLLNDGVASTVSLEAAQRIAQLLVSQRLTPAWLAADADELGQSVPGLWNPRERHGSPLEHTVVFSLRVVPADLQISLLAQQHISLFEEHADPTENGTAEDDAQYQPSFLRRQRLQSKLLDEATLEQRLHTYLGLWLNASLRLPPKRDDAVTFAAAYKRFFLTNKYFLTPAYGSLSLRATASLCPTESTEAKIQATLFRVEALANAVTLGVSPLALTRVLEAVAPGLLSLLSLDAFDPCVNKVHAQVERIVKHLYQADSAFAEVGRTLVSACRSTKTPRGYYRVHRNHVEGNHLEFVAASRPSPAETPDSDAESGDEQDESLNSVREGLRRLLFSSDPADGHTQSPDMPSDLKHAVFLALVDQSTHSLLLSEGSTTAAAEPPDGFAVSVTETACLAWNAEGLFGAAATVDKVVRLLTKTATLSSICLRWSLGLIPGVLDETTLARGNVNPSLVLPAVQSLARVVDCVVRDWSTAGGRAEGEVSAVSVLELAQHARASADAAIQYLELHVRAPAASDRMDASQGQHDSRWVNILASRTASIEASSDAQSPTMYSIALMEAANSVEEVALCAKQPLPQTLHTRVSGLVSVLLGCLFTTADVCAAGHAVRALTWIGMYRLDSADTSDLSRAAVQRLQQPSSEVRRSSERPTVTTKTLAEQSARCARGKARLLDVFLSWCDYDTDNRTLRNVDDWCLRESRGKSSLYHILAALCRAEEPAIVQVAAAHLVGHYVVHVFPRVGLSQVCQWCQDVFRHTKVEMSKAACASSLAQVVEFAASRNDFLQTPVVDVASVRHLAAAMSRYQPCTDTGATVADNTEVASHADAVRQHGRQIQSLLPAASAVTAVGEV